MALSILFLHNGFQYGIEKKIMPKIAANSCSYLHKNLISFFTTVLKREYCEKLNRVLHKTQT